MNWTDLKGTILLCYHIVQPQLIFLMLLYVSGVFSSSDYFDAKLCISHDISFLYNGVVLVSHRSSVIPCSLQEHFHSFAFEPIKFSFLKGIIY